MYVAGQTSVDPEALDMARQMALWDKDGLSYLSSLHAVFTVSRLVVFLS